MVHVVMVFSLLTLQRELVRVDIAPLEATYHDLMRQVRLSSEARWEVGQWC
jgi:hypothetical protein